MQTYLVLSRIASESGDRVWLPGSAIELDDLKATVLLRAEVIQAINDTVPPPIEAQPTQQVFEAPAPAEPTKKKGKGE